MIVERVPSRRSRISSNEPAESGAGVFFRTTTDELSGDHTGVISRSTSFASTVTWSSASTIAATAGESGDGFGASDGSAV